MGRHDGLWRFTIGQRARIMSMTDKAFVAYKDLAKNEIQVVLGTYVLLLAKDIFDRRNFQ